SDICGYSVNTVSLALRDDPKLPEKTRIKIREIASSAGYIRNSFASSLRSGKSNIIAIIVDDVLNLYYAAHIAEMEDALRAKGYMVMVLCTHGQAETEQQMLQYAASYGVDGIILAPQSSTPGSLELFKRLNCPIILIDREIPEAGLDTVCADDYEGGRLAGRALIRAGHRRLLYLSGSVANNSEALRKKGLFDELEESCRGEYALRTVSMESRQSSLSLDWFKPLLFPVDYTAIVSFNDDMAYQASLYLKEAGCADRVSIIGFDHIRSSFHYLPPMASIGCARHYSMPDAAIKVLLKRIADPDAEVRTIRLPVELYEGEAAGLS
ncbi:MAG: LacI family transcriptional regulator, partial [Lachnospiraceae bacterium]|nr:LacI family transcriptional regulator [Lachnospiraceae bacterium]